MVLMTTSTRSSRRNGMRLALIASTNSGWTPSAVAISRQRSASKPSTSPVVGLRKPKAMTSNLTPQVSLPLALIAATAAPPAPGPLAPGAGDPPGPQAATTNSVAMTSARALLIPYSLSWFGPAQACAGPSMAQDRVEEPSGSCVLGLLEEMVGRSRLDDF